MMTRYWKTAVLAGLVMVSNLAVAQRGDRDGHKMVEVWRDMDVPPAPPLTPGQALKTFTVAPGFRIELVAAEPLVEDPVAIAFDAAGRLWVAEMRGFMPNVEGRGEEVRNGVIAVLEDTDGDGRMDKRTEFLNELQMPRSLALVNGGVLVAEPPNLWFCRDTDGDLRCDTKEAVLEDYGRQGPVEHTDNGLMRGLDNWFYNAKSTKRFRFVSGNWVEENNIFRGQWGIAQDNYGRLYYNTNPNPVYTDLIPGWYLARHPHFDSKAGLNVKAFKSQKVWTGRVNPGINRGYQEKMLRDGHLAVFTSACGLEVYRGHQYPGEMVGDVFVCEPAGNMVRRQKVVFSEGRVTGDNACDRAEWLTSTDERFRPVSIANAPDGTLHVVDMYRGIIQHSHYVTTFLRKQILERALDRPLGLGRIYRVVHEDRSLPPVESLAGKSPEELADVLAHENGWYRDMAQRLLVDRQDKDVAGQLREIATAHDNPLARIHAFWTLEGLGALGVGTVNSGLADESPRVRITAMRLTEALLKEDIDDEEEMEYRLSLLTPIFDLAGAEDIDVRRQAILTLSEVRKPQVEPVLRAVLKQNLSDEIFRAAVLSGLADRELEFLQRLLVDEAWTARVGNAGGFLADIAAIIARRRSPERLERLLELAASQAGKTAWRRDALLKGLVAVANPNRGRKPKAVHYEQQPVAFAKLAEVDSKSVKAGLKKLEKFVTWGEEAAPPPPPRPLTAGEQKLFDEGRELYQVACATCHQASGLGEEGKAPPLLDSPYLVGSPRIASAIVLQGLTGPIEVHGRTYDMTMPALQGFNEDQIAAILTYARREWEHGAEPITGEQVRQVKEFIGERELPWTADELKKLGAGE